MTFSYFAFKNSAPNCASAAYAATNLRTWNCLNITPLRWMGCLSCGVHPRKKCPADLLHKSISDKYEAYEWMFRIILDA